MGLCNCVECIDRSEDARLDSAVLYAEEGPPPANDAGARVAYRQIQLLGRGPRGTVHLCQRPVGAQRYAVKAVPQASVLRVDAALADQLRRLEHPHVVSLVDLLEDQNGHAVLLVSEYVAGGTLMQLDSAGCALTAPLGEDRCRRYLEQAAAGLDFLHCNDVTHSSLKPSNLLLDPSSDTVRLADFGGGLLSTIPDDTAEGLPFFLPPEACKARPLRPSRPADLWQLGATFFCLAAGHAPFRAPDRAKLLHAIRHDALRLPAACPSGLAELLGALLLKDPAHRMSLLAVQQHPWVAGTPMYSMRDGNLSSASLLSHCSTSPLCPSTPPSHRVLLVSDSHAKRERWRQLVGDTVQLQSVAVDEVVDCAAGRAALEHHLYSLILLDVDSEVLFETYDMISILNSAKQKATNAEARVVVIGLVPAAPSAPMHPALDTVADDFLRLPLQGPAVRQVCLRADLPLREEGHRYSFRDTALAYRAILEARGPEKEVHPDSNLSCKSLTFSEEDVPALVVALLLRALQEAFPAAAPHLHPALAADLRRQALAAAGLVLRRGLRRVAQGSSEAVFDDHDVRLLLAGPIAQLKERASQALRDVPTTAAPLHISKTPLYIYAHRAAGARSYYMVYPAAGLLVDPTPPSSDSLAGPKADPLVPGMVPRRSNPSSPVHAAEGGGGGLLLGVVDGAGAPATAAYTSVVLPRNLGSCLARGLEPAAALGEALRQTEEEARQFLCLNAAGNESATTTLVAVLRDGALWVASAGHSRVLVVPRGCRTARRLTSLPLLADQTPVANGTAQPPRQRVFPNPDLTTHRLDPEADLLVVLACGVWRVLTQDEMLRFLRDAWEEVTASIAEARRGPLSVAAVKRRRASVLYESSLLLLRERVRQCQPDVTLPLPPGCPPLSSQAAAQCWRRSESPSPDIDLSSMSDYLRIEDAFPIAHALVTEAAARGCGPEAAAVVLCLQDPSSAP